MFMGDRMRLTGAVSVIGPMVVYVGLQIYDGFKNQNTVSSIKIETQTLWKAALTLYTCVITYMTIISKLPSGTDHQLNLHLFWSYGRWKAADIRWQIYMNVFLFIPFGFFLRCKSVIKSFIIAFALSALIELTQYIFCLGLCELDDVFHNTLGAMIGCGYYRVLDALWKRIESIVK